jgi:hypothetical protein
MDSTKPVRRPERPSTSSSKAEPRYRGRPMFAVGGLHGALDRRLVGSCVSCGAHARRWRDAIADDKTAVVRIAMDSAGRPVLRATCSDACDVCGASELKIVTVEHPP